MDTTEKRLHTTTDAAVWAEEFMNIANKLEIKGIDEGWMIGWFANAIETGRQFGRLEIKECKCP